MADGVNRCLFMGLPIGSPIERANKIIRIPLSYLKGLCHGVNRVNC